MLAVKGNQQNLEDAIDFYMGRGHSQVPRSKLTTMISASRWSGHVRVHGIFFGSHRHSGGSGICAPIIAREERGWRKR